jgi:hypothetical protein
MNWLSYQTGVRLARADVDFYALVIAAMIRADTTNAARLRSVFPELWDETQRRYDAPGGLIGDEVMTEGMGRMLARRYVVQA